MTDHSDLLKQIQGLAERDDTVDVRKSFNLMSAKNLDARSIKKIIDLVEKMEQLQKESGTQKWFSSESPWPIESLPKHKAFFDAGAEYDERLAMAANRVGKSIMGCYEMTCHLTGIYPIWWAGRVFEHAIDAWAVGPDARAVRDTVQKELLGPMGEWGTGMIPAHLIGKYSALQGTPGAIDQLMVKHSSGKWSRLGFKNYQQELKSFMGTARHVIWCDEEVPLDIYNECLIRTATTKGIMISTFTPLEGLTPMVVNFCKNADFLLGARPIVSVDQTSDEENMDMLEESQAVGRGKLKAVLQLGWDDAPWLDEETKYKLLEGTPIHLRDARSKGLPAMGSGNVYAVPVEELLVDPFPIPDSWPKMYALDVGWNRTAATWGALDPVTDTLYIYDEHYQGESLPPVHAYAIKSRGEWMQGVIDPAAHGRSQTDGNKLYRNYRDLGLHIFNAKNEFESGILAVQQRIIVKKLRIFKTCINLQKEYLLYRRDKNGKVVKENDHLLDTVRYIVLNMHRMASKSDFIRPQGMGYKPTNYRI